MKIERRHYTGVLNMRYPEEDLFGYPDTLVRSRLSAAYLNACNILRPFEPETVLDIGSYHGHGVNTIARELDPKTIVSSDKLINFLEIQQRVLSKENNNLLFQFVGLSAPDLPFQAASIDATFLIHVVEHIKNPYDLLAEMKRITKPGGHVIIATPDKSNLVGKNPRDEHVFTDEELKKLLKDVGFQAELYYLIPNRHARKVHERKKWLATHLPITGKLRTYVPWKIWDRMILRGDLRPADFFYLRIITTIMQLIY